MSDFEHRMIDAGEVRLHIVEARPATVTDDTPLVLLLHGFPEHWWSWRSQLSALRDAGYWAIAPDMRGYGQSDKPYEVGEYEVEKLAGDVAGVIRAVGRKKAIVVGHDWGGVIAWAFAMEHPDMLERLAILNVPHPLQMLKGLKTAKQLKKSWYMFFFQLPKIPELAIAKDDYAMVRKTFAIDGVPADEIERYVEALRIPGVVRSAVNYYRASIRRVASGRTPKMKVIEQPVLVIWGDRDRHLGKEMAEPPPRFVPHARTVHLPDASHWVQRDEPARVNELLLEHFRAS